MLSYIPSTTKGSTIRPETASTRKITIVKSVNRLHTFMTAEPSSAKHATYHDQKLRPLTTKLEREGLYENVMD